MISKCVPRQPSNDSYKRLAEYIQAASHKGEKCIEVWTEGCYAGQDYKLAIAEIEATQKMNQRTTKEKTYHLVISFHPEDMKKLSIQDFKDIEKEFARGLGFEEHQRHCGIHVDTDNPHMHVAYNMIHKEKYTRHDPYYDYSKRNQVCRDLEEKYGLKIDVGIEQQFKDYVDQARSDIACAFDKATSWQSLHQGLATYGLTVQLRGNGCILAAIGYKQKEGHYIKLSDFDSTLSKQKLQERFGEYERTTGDYEVKEIFRRKPKRENQRAKTFESKTGIKSFNTFIQEQNEFIKNVAEVATSWQGLHQELASIGLEIKPRGNGYILKDIGGKTDFNSTIAFSKTGLRIAELEKKFGQFEASQGNYEIKKSYKIEPLKKLKKAKEKEAWRIYIKQRKYRNAGWKKFSKNLQRFFEEGQEL